MITIGTDPEYLLVDKHGEIRCANDFGFFSSTSSQAEIGCDGAGIPVEIRPPPASITNVNKLLADIDRILKEVSVFCKGRKFKLYAGANYEGRKPIGGHIHFGSEKLRKSGAHKNKLVRLLDCYFTPISNFFISPRDLDRRLGSGYGDLGAMETKSYGFEYRTPYSFLMSPFLTKGLFSLASLIAYHYRKMSVDETLRDDVRRYYSDLRSTTKLNRIYKQIKPSILKLMRYGSPNPKNNSHILSLFNLIERGKKCANKEIFSNWKFIEKEIKAVMTTYNLIYSDDEYVSSIQSLMRRQGTISNPNPGSLYIYGVGIRNEIPSSNENCIYLSQGMPKPPANSVLRYEYNAFGQGRSHVNSIGISNKLRYEITAGMQPDILSELFNYVNTVKIQNSAGRNTYV